MWTTKFTFLVDSLPFVFVCVFFLSHNVYAQKQKLYL